jgi:hypothetical protein
LAKNTGLKPFLLDEAHAAFTLGFAAWYLFKKYKLVERYTMDRATRVRFQDGAQS